MWRAAALQKMCQQIMKNKNSLLLWLIVTLLFSRMRAQNRDRASQDMASLPLPPFFCEKLQFFINTSPDPSVSYLNLHLWG